MSSPVSINVIKNLTTTSVKDAAVGACYAAKMLRNDRDFSEQALDTMPLSDCLPVRPYDGILAELHEQLGWMFDTLEILEGGTTRVVRGEHPHAVNDTPSWIVEQKRRIARLDHVISAYEQKNT